MEYEKNIDGSAPSGADLDAARVDLGRAAKLRLILTVPPEHELNWLQAEFKRRGIQKADLGEIVTDALAQVPRSWWAQKVDDLTPLEFKVQQALENPSLREKLTALLATMDSQNTLSS